ncbi:MAG: polymer-forming cytoskeletal protein [Chloroflexi bacterium]|nr:polymer-forming cytoskeletal protein [Chloroflexota bacterium]
MKNKLLNVVIYLSLPLILAFAWPSSALAQGPGGDQVVLGDNLVLKPEEKINGDVVVFGGNVTMPSSSEIDGDLVVFGGNADIEGRVTGDIGMIGGNVNLGKTAVIKGDIGLLGGNADVAEGATVEGDVHRINRFGFGDDGGFDIPPIPSVSPVPPIPPVPSALPDDVGSTFPGWAGRVFGFFKGVFEDVALLLSLAVISWLVAAFMPEQMKMVGDTLTHSAPFSFGIGLLTSLMAGVVGGVLLITICLAFVPLLGFILLSIATLFGWIVAGQVIGERLLIAGGRPYPSLVSSTVLGVTVLTIMAAMPIIGQLPCIGFIFGLVGGLVGIVIALSGLGAVILTRFGTQPYPPSTYAFAGGGFPAPRPAPATGDDWSRSDPLSSLERSEAELRAKIKAALDEADAAAEPPSVDEPTDETAPDKPSMEDAAAEKPATEENISDEKPARKRRQPKKSTADPADGETNL